MTIREATAEDAPELARLRWLFSLEQVAAGRQSYAAFSREYEAFVIAAFAAGTWKAWMAEADSRLVGNVYAEIIPKLPRPGECGNSYAYLTNVYVEDEFRNQGVGGRLIEAATAWAKARKMEFMMVWPSAESISFYQRYGFSQSEAMERKP